MHVSDSSFAKDVDLIYIYIYIYSVRMQLYVTLKEWKKLNKKEKNQLALDVFLLLFFLYCKQKDAKSQVKSSTGLYELWKIFIFISG